MYFNQFGEFNNSNINSASSSKVGFMISLSVSKVLYSVMVLIDSLKLLLPRPIHFAGIVFQFQGFAFVIGLFPFGERYFELGQPAVVNE